MDTLLHIVALVRAMHHNDIAAAAHLLDELEAQLGPEELADLLESILGDEPAGAAKPPLPSATLCA